MEIENDGMLPFLGTQMLNKSTQIQTKIYVKPTNTGLLLHYKSHVDDRYKRGLLKTMLDRAFRLSSNCDISLVWDIYTLPNVGHTGRVFCS